VKTYVNSSNYLSIKQTHNIQFKQLPDPCSAVRDANSAKRGLELMCFTAFISSCGQKVGNCDTCVIRTHAPEGTG
jgi:hypothetical protein